MRDFVRYLDNLVATIKGQQKGLRRLSRKNKRLRQENEELARLYRAVCQQNDRFADRLAAANKQGVMV